MKYTLFLMFLLCMVSVSADLSSLNSDAELQDMSEQKKAIAQEIAQNLNKSGFCAFLASRMEGHNSTQSLVSLLSDYVAVFGDSRCGQLLDGCSNFDKSIRSVKGIENRLSEILQIRLHAQNMRGNDAINFQEVLVAYAPKGEESEWKHIEAFDAEGNVHQLSVNEEPSMPVLIVELDSKADMAAGLALLNDELKAAGLQTEIPQNRAGLNVAKLDYIRIADVKEPWILGDAEIYTLVNGISTEANRPNIISQEMPYVDKDGREYFPNQVLIVWQNYRYQACNLNVFEHDDSTNYKEIAAKLIDAIGQISTEYKALFDLGSQIIRLMPDQWFTNDDDYVDVFYTLENKEYRNHKGASNNAQITIRPYVISE